MHESELLEALCQPLVEYLRTKCTPPISIEVTDYGFFVNRGGAQEYHEIPCGKEEKMELKDFKTCELVEELKKREGVETHIAEPYEDLSVTAPGPAVVLVVID